MRYTFARKHQTRKGRCRACPARRRRLAGRLNLCLVALRPGPWKEQPCCRKGRREESALSKRPAVASIPEPVQVPELFDVTGPEHAHVDIRTAVRLGRVH